MENFNNNPRAEFARKEEYCEYLFNTLWAFLAYMHPGQSPRVYLPD